MMRKKIISIASAVKVALAVAVCAMMLAGCGKDETKTEEAVEETLVLSDNAFEESTKEVKEETQKETEETVEESTVESEEGKATDQEVPVAEFGKVEAPAPTPVAEPEPTFAAEQVPEPTPAPEPESEPIPAPEPESELISSPTPAPESGKNPEATPKPKPEPESESEPHIHTMVEDWLYKPTCSSSGYVNYICSECEWIDKSKSGSVDFLPHTPEGRIIVKGDCISPSVTRYECSECGLDQCQPDTKSDEPGQPDGHEWVSGSYEELDKETLEYITIEVTGCSRCGLVKE